MAIAASYTMHLYCDCRQCTEGVYPVPDFVSISVRHGLVVQKRPVKTGGE